ncbi:hypothetical protein [Maridesulfovibrio hydrothermalis]|uniref:Flagellar assembly protein T, N-terminal domain n=1 Tax=Maridesulfovibrio hydrothermalis AM13 = DSM 14728 TaxID=1121451 RepID=L0RFY8_9BACT|nr:hypothetical protein [Maridesulfovibrio hydrothermalis]CCO25125.1 conserved exported protein of unknown function [Maridesulfovibrio hydrothermalis AM13 = DSM 14728]
MSFLKLYLRGVAISIAILLTASTAFAVQATGEGIDRHQALNSALRSAVEIEIGTAVASDSIVESGVLVRDEIASHSKGYVTTYKVLSEGILPDGYIITIDAEVDHNLLFSDYTTVSLLQKMSNLPRLLIFGSGGGFNSVPPESMKSLVHDVAKVFGDKFQFEVIDWPMSRASFHNIEGSMTLDKAIKNNKQLQADYVVTVELELPPSANPVMHLKCVRISDRLKVGETRRPVERYVSLSGKPAQIYSRAVDAAKPEVYWGAVRIARDMLEYMESELDRGKGFRYSMSFLGFPEIDLVGTSLENIPGYVRKEVKRKSGRNMELVYWSTLRPEALLKRVDTSLKNLGVGKFKSRMDGRNIKFRWENPDGF